MKFFFHMLIEFIRDEQYRSLFGASLVILFGGALFYSYVEGWRYLDALYFSAITLTTIGYGDFSPQTDLGKIFTILYIGIGVGLILTFVNSVFSHFRSSQRTFAKRSRKKK
jgi:voltage-gated potassium channel